MIHEKEWERTAAELTDGSGFAELWAAARAQAAIDNGDEEPPTEEEVGKVLPPNTSIGHHQDPTPKKVQIWEERAAANEAAQPAEGECDDLFAARRAAREATKAAESAAKAPA
ncbi:hypothetical protein FDECE_14122 [Fusarium decemcellulare]|nr:hypothetical protein FDECE_14122 [Fusarium decemcellulare]